MRSPAQANNQRWDCQHSWKRYPKPSSSDSIIEIAVAPLTSEIPEFHDCQKLIAPDGATYVVEPVAIFAHQTLLAQWDELVHQRDTTTTTTSTNIRAGANASVVDQSPDIDLKKIVLNTPDIPIPGGDAVVVAEILNYGPDYPALGVKAGFNCLFVTLGRDLRIRAVMVKVLRDQDCRPKAQFDTLVSKAGGKELAVHISKPSRNQRDYPPVARWDWDAQNRKHYIGIMCGAAWCEVGDSGFARSPRYAGGRTHTIKGWYDEQRLAMTAKDGESLIPSDVIGTVFPAPQLGTYTDASFHARWVHVASVALSRVSAQYEYKLNLQPSPPNEAANTILLCSGTKPLDCAPKEKLQMPDGTVGLFPATWRLPACKPTEDGKIWWASIRAAKTGREVFRCIQRTVVSPAVGSSPTLGWPNGIKVPATARWRWLLKDETIWQACIQGCCQVET